MRIGLRVVQVGHGGGRPDEVELSMAFGDNGVEGIRVTYVHHGRVVASEVIDLRSEP